MDMTVSIGGMFIGGSFMKGKGVFMPGFSLLDCLGWALACDGAFCMHSKGNSKTCCLHVHRLYNCRANGCNGESREKKEEKNT